jgi:hypothetical protein
MAPIKCFLVQPTDEGPKSLRRYCPSSKSTCPGKYGYHNASVVTGDVKDPVGEDGIIHNPPMINHSDPRWPAKCEHCDYCFQEDDYWQTNLDVYYASTDPEIPGRWTQRQLPAGAMFYPSWLQPKSVYTEAVEVGAIPDRPKRWQTGPDGKCLMVVTPGGEWIIDGRASNCDMPEDNAHRCWVRHGEPPNITVDKNGLTCGAGGGSIQCGDYHGYLRDGWLVDA